LRSALSSSGSKSASSAGGSSAESVPPIRFLKD